MLRGSKTVDHVSSSYHLHLRTSLLGVRLKVCGIDVIPLSVKELYQGFLVPSMSISLDKTSKEHAL